MLTWKYLRAAEAGTRREVGRIKTSSSFGARGQHLWVTAAEDTSLPELPSPATTRMGSSRRGASLVPTSTSKALTTTLSPTPPPSPATGGVAEFTSFPYLARGCQERLASQVVQLYITWSQLRLNHHCLKSSSCLGFIKTRQTPLLLQAR